MLAERLDLTGLEALAARVAGLARPGDAILLEGTLGAGKTSFARAFLRAWTRDPALDVPSPSFTLVQSYDAAGQAAHHLDLWRLSGPPDLAELGWDDLLAGIVLVEWPDRLGHLTPPGALRLSLYINKDGTRRVEATGWTRLG